MFSWFQEEEKNLNLYKQPTHPITPILNTYHQRIAHIIIDSTIIYYLMHELSFIIV